MFFIYRSKEKYKSYIWVSHIRKESFNLFRPNIFNNLTKKR